MVVVLAGVELAVAIRFFQQSLQQAAVVVLLGARAPLEKMAVRVVVVQQVEHLLTELELLIRATMVVLVVSVAMPMLAVVVALVKQVIPMELDEVEMALLFQ